VPSPVYDGAVTCAVSVHDRLGGERLRTVMEPMPPDAALRLIESAVRETVSASVGPRDAEVDVTLCGDSEMERLNFDHMGERGPTDVLSFPLHEWSVDGRSSVLADDDPVVPPGPLVLGDVVIDVDQALRQSAEGNWDVIEEVVLLAIHGTLHLVGHDHADLEEEGRMRELEHEVLGVLHRRHRDVSWTPGSLFDRAGHAVAAGT
jgi:probable rRNA maturation factor